MATPDKNKKQPTPPDKGQKRPQGKEQPKAQQPPLPKQQVVQKKEIQQGQQKHQYSPDKAKAQIPPQQVPKNDQEKRPQKQQTPAKSSQAKLQAQQQLQAQFLQKVEQSLLRALTESDPKIFLMYSRIAAEGVLQYLYLRSGKGSLSERSDPLTISELRKLVPNHPYAVIYIQNYGNVGAHFNLDELRPADVVPCKIAVSDLVRFLYQRYLKTKIPSTLAPHLIKSSSSQFEKNSSTYALIINDVWGIINALKYDRNSLPKKFYNLLQSIYSYIITEHEQKIDARFFRDSRTLNFIDLNEHAKTKQYISAIHAAHLRHLISFTLHNIGKAKRPKQGENIHSIYDAFVGAIVLFFERYIGELPEDLQQLFQGKKATEERALPEQDQKIVAWLVRQDERQSMAYSLREGKNIIGRQSDLRDKSDKIVINDIQISRQHACIEVVKQEDGTYLFYLTDEKPSRNGTFINAPSFRLQATDKVLLEENDRIYLGTNLIQLLFKPITEEAESLAPSIGLTEFPDA